MIKKTHRIKNLVVTTGALLILAGAPIIPANPLGEYMNTMTGSITAQAAEQLPYSSNWETQADNSWKYRMNDGTYATSAWIQDDVDLNWYVFDGNGVMRSGLYKSFGKYYLLSQAHDGHFGHMVKNGETYNGILIQADTSADSEGALTQESLTALRAQGLYVENAVDLSGTQHVSKGTITLPPQSSTQPDTNSETKTETKSTSTSKSAKSQSSNSSSDEYISGSYEDALNRMGTNVDVSHWAPDDTKWK